MPDEKTTTEEEYITPERLQRLLHGITYHFCANQQAMRKTHAALSALIDEFAASESAEYQASKNKQKKKSH